MWKKFALVAAEASAVSRSAEPSIARLRPRTAQSRRKRLRAARVLITSASAAAMILDGRSDK
jgi:hypothetical protein